ncbi:MAG: 3-phosphoserine/phosphohydroxythreonine transaminase [Ruminococcaceae bacterium]|nr:3-phosphoserine/phosphohydroxythreonine transaminase [Oscillospiraceae bacterium]
MTRPYNFSAGPSTLPESVLNKAAAQMLDYEGTGQSVMEMSHRSEEFKKILNDTEALLREIMNVPDNYNVLFLQGGATTQFSAIPMNLMTGSGKADYVVSGLWSKKATKEAQRYGDIKIVATSEDKNFYYAPKFDKSQFRPDADYFYYCMNETVHGNIIREIPDTGNVPIVCDISSCVLSEPIDVTKFDMVYGGAQKNMAPAGVTFIIYKKGLIKKPMDLIPTMLDYDKQAAAGSMLNTPPCYTIYMCKLVLEWVKKAGGLEAMKIRSETKAKILYNFLDNSEIFTAPVPKEDRSLMNVPFFSTSPELDAEFVKAAREAGFVNLKGHSSTGGMRASLYNGMPIEGVEALVEFMKKFEEEHKKNV